MCTHLHNSFLHVRTHVGQNLIMRVRIQTYKLNCPWLNRLAKGKYAYRVNALISQCALKQHCQLLYSSQKKNTAQQMPEALDISFMYLTTKSQTHTQHPQVGTTHTPPSTEATKHTLHNPTYYLHHTSPTPPPHNTHTHTHREEHVELVLIDGLCVWYSVRVLHDCDGLSGENGLVDLERGGVDGGQPHVSWDLVTNCKHRVTQVSLATANTA